MIDEFIHIIYHIVFYVYIYGVQILKEMGSLCQNEFRHTKQQQPVLVELSASIGRWWGMREGDNGGGG